MTGEKSLLHRIFNPDARDGRVPCDTCEYWNYCARNAAACVDFVKYIQKSGTPSDLRRFGSTRIPLRAIHDFVFSPFDMIPTGEKDSNGNQKFKWHPETLKRKEEAKRELESHFKRSKANKPTKSEV